MENYHYEWRIVHDGIGRVPNIRSDAASFYYQNCMWITCGAGSGLGKSSEVWKFDLASKLWHKIDISPQDSPTMRDGHSGAYIGEGKFVIFGGQGFSEPNKKLGRESDQLKAQTHCKRDVFNDLWVFDCNSLKWTPIYPDGLSFPMGRRGHSVVYIPKNTIAREEDERKKLHKLQHNRHHPGGNDEGSVASYSTYGTSVGASSATSSHRSAVKNADADHPSTSNAAVAAAGNAYMRSHHHKPAPHVFEPLPENSLVVFGGAGIELSKYTEQLYNDVWVYSFESNTWHRHETRGLEPHPTVNHRVVRNGENMIVVGGIVGANVVLPGMAPPPSASGPHGALDGDVQVLNLRTATWSILRVLDHTGRPTKVNSLGFTVVEDVDPLSEQQLYVPVKSLLVFGGKENIDSKLAATTRQTKRQQLIATSALPANARRMSHAQRNVLQTMAEKTYHHFHADGDILDPWSVSDDQLMLLDIDQGTMTILQTKQEGSSGFGGGVPVSPPEGRYGHMAVAAVNPKEYQLEQQKEAEAAFAAAASIAANANRHGVGGRTSRTARRMMTGTSRTARGGFGGNDLPAELPVMYVFGGCRLENNGYCDPALYSLVKVYHQEKSHAGGFMATGRTDFSGGIMSTRRPPMTERGPPDADIHSLARLSLAAPGGSRDSAVVSPAVGTPTSPHSPFGFSDNGGFSTPHSVGAPMSHRPGPGTTRFAGIGGGAMLLEQSIFSAAAAAGHSGPEQPIPQSMSVDLLSQPSIWTNIQRKEQLNVREPTLKSPSNWDEMKLSLTSSRSLRHLGSAGSVPGTASHGQLPSSPSMPSLQHNDSSGVLINGHNNGSLMQRSRTALGSASTPSLQEFTFRTVSSFNRGAPYSPWNTSSNLTGGLDGARGSPSPGGRGTSAGGLHGMSLAQDSSAWGTSSHNHLSASSNRQHSSHSASRLLSPPMSAGRQEPTAQSMAVDKELRKERIQLIKATLKPVIHKQSKTIARDTFKSLFPLNPDM